jgi:hypothetical protein
MAIDNYLAVITSQHRTKPKFMAEVAAVLDMIDPDPSDTIEGNNAAFDIETAEGAQLDIIGRIVNLNRVLPFQPSDGTEPVMTDDVYRIALKAKIIFNQWDGTIPSLREKWKFLFPEAPIIVKDNQDMSMTVVILDNYRLIYKDLLINNMLIPHPAGVKLWYFFGESPVFGFDLENEGIAGFDIGNWLFFAPPPSFCYGEPGVNQGGYGTGYWI